MLKKIIGFSLVVMSLVVVVPAFAEEAGTTSGTTGGTLSVSGVAPTNNAEKIACVKAAVAERESALSGAVLKHQQSVNAAYSTRVAELAGAYSNTTAKNVRAGVRVAWADFSKSMKSANDTWRSERKAAWSKFKDATKACKANDISDSGNSGAELSM